MQLPNSCHSLIPNFEFNETPNHQMAHTASNWWATAHNSFFFEIRPITLLPPNKPDISSPKKSRGGTLRTGGLRPSLPSPSVQPKPHENEIATKKKKCKPADVMILSDHLLLISRHGPTCPIEQTEQS